MTEDIINSCVMCLLPRSDDFLSIFVNTEKGRNLNKYGKMYEDLLNVQIDDQCVFPSYICSSCSLQLQLSINLKQKSLESFRKIISFSNNFLDTIKEENTMSEYGINFNEDEDFSKLVDDSDLSNENTIEMNFTETADQDDNSNHSSQSNYNDPSYYEDEDTEFLDVQYLKEEYDEDHVNKNFADFKNTSKLNFSIGNKSHKESESEEIIILTIDENDPKKLNLIEIEELETASTKSNLKLNTKYSTSNLKHQSKNKKQLNTKKRIKYLCDLCTKVSYSKEAFEVHTKIHAGLPAFKCEICEKNFNQKVHYNIHMMNHTNERNYECKECGKKFKTKTDLRIHFEIHTGERRYVCDICSKTYRAHSHMKNHRYTHFEKQLECQICKQKYISPATLRTHIKTIHEMVLPQFECTLCHKKFKRKHHLQVHMKTHNKNKQIGNTNETFLEVLEMTNYIQEIEEIVES